LLIPARCNASSRGSGWAYRSSTRRMTRRTVQSLDAVGEMWSQQFQFGTTESGDMIADESQPAATFDERQFHFPVQVPVVTRTHEWPNAAIGRKRHHLVQVVQPAQQPEG
jgi:hypothetical protein